MTRVLPALLFAALVLVGARAQDVAVLEPCVEGDSAQEFKISEPLGVISSSGLCLCAAAGSGVGALSFAKCEGAGAVHEHEVNFSVPVGASRALTWGSLCAEAGATASNASLSLVLDSCNPKSLSWRVDASTQIIDVASGMCLTVGAAPPPPPSLFATVFGSDMVLQRDTPITLWGASTPSAVVFVSFNGVSYPSAPTDGNGRWTVTLPPTPASGPSGVNITATSPTQTQTLVSVLFGDVVWCSGQSNLDSSNTPVRYAFNATAEIAASAALSPWVRLFKVRHATSMTPLSDLSSLPELPWTIAGPLSVAPFSATCWFHGRELALALGPAIPIGLVESAWGGTSIQPWSAPGLNDTCGDDPSYPGGWPTQTSVLWNAMTFPFSGMRFSGIVWYQGESNALTSTWESDFYLCALPRLVTSLRTLFLSPLAHAAIVQLAPWASSSASLNVEVATLREAQLRAGDALANMSVITAVDGGDPFGPIGSIHPRAKQLVGRRTAAAVLSTVFGRATPYAGPRFVSAVAGGGGAGSFSATLSFSGGGGKLTLITPSATGPYANSSVCPTGVGADLCCGFMIGGSDGSWRTASGTLSHDNTRLVLAATAPAGVTATGVASGWGLWPISLLYGSNGIVAFPFNGSIAA